MSRSQVSRACAPPVSSTSAEKAGHVIWHTRGDGERGKDSNVEVAVVLALHVLDERVHVVCLDRLHKRLGLPTQARALAADTHGREVLELGQWPGLGGAVAAEYVPAHPAVMFADDEREDKPARLALHHIATLMSPAQDKTMSKVP